jgi:hypothetical protein
VVENDEKLYIIENLDPDEKVGPVGLGRGVKAENNDSSTDLSAP